MNFEYWISNFGSFEIVALGTEQVCGLSVDQRAVLKWAGKVGQEVGGQDLKR